MNWKGSGRKGRDLIETQACRLPEGTQENDGIPRWGQPLSRCRLEPYISYIQITSHKTVIFISSAVRTPNLTSYVFWRPLLLTSIATYPSGDRTISLCFSFICGTTPLLYSEGLRFECRPGTGYPVVRRDYSQSFREVTWNRPRQPASSQVTDMSLCGYTPSYAVSAVDMGPYNKQFEI
jgi:hypothetical protein